MALFLALVSLTSYRRNESLNRFMKAYADVVKLPTPVISSFDLSQLLNNLATLFYAECQKRNIIITLDVKQSIMINADAHLMEQALVNVLKNAIEAIGQGGTISLTLEKHKASYQLLVKDTGSGIDEDVSQQLFTPFFTTKESGQGVGLMLIHEIMAQHNFDYSLKNNTECPGATFTIYFTPAAQ